MIEQLLASTDPIIRYKVRVSILGEDRTAPEVLQLQQEIKTSTRIQRLLSDRDEQGVIPFHPYTKWQGAHWVLVCLAEVCYPSGDQSLLPLRDQVYEWLLSQAHHQDAVRRTGKNSQIRLHASMEGNALLSSLALGLAESRTERLVEQLLWAQWDDGGWNCDRHARADTSSFYESITPLRALARWVRESGDPKARGAVERAVEVFLKRGLFRRVRDGAVIRDEFLKLRLPAFHYYNILWALKVIAEAGCDIQADYLHDPRCREALDLLESKRLPDGGFPAEGKYYYVTHKNSESLPHGSRVDWGAVGRGKANELVTVEALATLRAAGRFTPSVGIPSINP